MPWSASKGAELGGRYALDEKIGEGGMGEVWRARHLALESSVAIKFLSGALASNEETKKRFLVEAKVTAQIKTRNAVQVFDFGLTDDGQPYIVMELLSGEPLSARIERLGRLDKASTALVMHSAAKALAKAHSLNIVHRDFKPDNVFLTKTDDEEDEVKVVDFGIAKLLGSLDDTRVTQEDFNEIAGKALSSLTRTGKLVGTPHYMCPEQILVLPDIGPAADVWAFGIVAFECLTGRCPYDGENLLALFASIQRGVPKRASEIFDDIPPAFDDWFAIACAKKPQDRFNDVQVAALRLADALDVSGLLPEATGTALRRVPLMAHGDVVIDHSSPSHDGVPVQTMLASSSGVENVPRKGRATWAIAGVAAAALAFAVFAFVRGRPQEPVAHTEQAPPALAASAQPGEAASALALPVRDPIPNAREAATEHDAAATHANVAPPTATPTSTPTAKTSRSNTPSTTAAAPQPTTTPQPATAPTKPAANPAPPKPQQGPQSPFSLPPLGI